MTAVHLLVLLISLAGFAGLALAMPKHGKAIFRQPLSDARRQLLRLAGWLLLAVALALGMDRWRFDIGTVTWLGWLSVAGLVLVFVLSRWAVRPGSRPKNEGSFFMQRPAQKSGNADSESADTGPSLSTRGTVFAAAALLIPLAWFTGQLLTTPIKPLLREDAIHGDVGPWSFTLAEKEQNQPEIVALNVPLKAFVIRFCDGCERDIRMAYLKVREPRFLPGVGGSLRAAGNAFEGRGREKTAEVPLPRAATLGDGLWLTVEATNGEVYHQRFDIQRLSPAMARFIREDK